MTIPDEQITTFVVSLLTFISVLIGFAVYLIGRYRKPSSTPSTNGSGKVDDKVQRLHERIDEHIKEENTRCNDRLEKCNEFFMDSATDRKVIHGELINLGSKMDDLKEQVADGFEGKRAKNK